MFYLIFIKNHHVIYYFRKIVFIFKMLLCFIFFNKQRAIENTDQQILNVKK